MDPIATASIISAILASGVTGVGSWLTFRNKKDEVSAGVRQHIDARIDNYTDRLERRLKEERDHSDKKIASAEKKIAELLRRVDRLSNENKELKTWAAAVKRDLWALHKSVRMAAKILASETSDKHDAQQFMTESLEKLDSLLEETRTLIEESTPTLDGPVP